MGGIRVLAGTNGAGKSSILGRDIESVGAQYLNPDAVAHELALQYPELSGDSLNGIAWQVMVNELGSAIASGSDFAFETTLGGNTITSELVIAADRGRDVQIAYVGLASPELHIERVRARVRGGGHDVPEDRIRARYVAGLKNLIRLMPGLTRLDVYDNSEPSADGAPMDPTHYLTLEHHAILYCVDVSDANAWARPILQAAIDISE